MLKGDQWIVLFVQDLGSRLGRSMLKGDQWIVLLVR
jgi:hypothetical protein